mgnify:CR=1 FL=1
MPAGLLAYLVPSLCWVGVAVISIFANNLLGGLDSKWRIVYLAAFLAAIFQIALLVDAGLITKFGRSPVSFAPRMLILNSIMVLSSVFGVEFSRAHILRNLGRRKPLLSLMLMSLLHSPVLALLRMPLSNVKPLLFVEFLGSDFLPALAQNLLASYLALLAGPIASIAYVMPLSVFQWFSPVLPDLPWSLKSLLGVVSPTISLVAINYATPREVLRSAGLKIDVFRGWKKKESPAKALAPILIFVLAVWFSTGLLSVFPSVVMSGSMQPTLNVGDIAILVKVPPNKIQLGDIIQYVGREGAVLHRVVAIKQGYFVTKGDANNAIDYDPVYSSQIKGKLLLIIPKLGWISIYMKIIVFSIFSFIYYNQINLISFMISVSFVFSYFIYNYFMKRRKFGRWR